MTIWANCIIHNEENFIWFAIMSIVDYVDKVLVWDTGSNDKTVEIIKEIIKIKGDKIEFKEVGEVDKNEFTKMRQRQLDDSKCDWILILDGDEIWWEDSIKKVVDLINTKEDRSDSIVMPFYNMVGDIHHYQSHDAGKYMILGKRGHLTIRAIKRSIPGLHLAGPYGMEGYLDETGKPIQESNYRKLYFLDAPFMHMTHLKRSSKDDHKKIKYDKGLKFIKDFPEVFYLEKPKVVPTFFYTRSKLYEAISYAKAIFKS